MEGRLENERLLGERMPGMDDTDAWKNEKEEEGMAERKGKNGL